jgi:mono/diheme cytochrome c family protein
MRATQGRLSRDPHRDPPSLSAARADLQEVGSARFSKLKGPHSFLTKHAFLFRFCLAVSTVWLALGCNRGPQFSIPAQLVHLDQGPRWTAKERAVFYYTPQGTELHGLRYAWFLALEQVKGRELFSAPANLARFGFLYSPEQMLAVYQPPAYNPGNLPVGFTHHKDNLSGDALLDVTCAACHTGQLEYRGTALRVDGGQAMHAFASTAAGEFAPELIAAMVVTYIDPFTFDRFAKRVLGTRYPDQKPVLRDALEASIAGFTHEAWHTILVRNLYSDDGYGRIDALGHIANTVFGDEFDPRNATVANAPVSYPHLWDIWKFDWVQWNGSVAQPMGRNVGESLGVKARLGLVDRHGKALPKDKIYDSSTLVRELDCIETTLWKLDTPRWDEHVLPPIDRRRAAQGKDLFEKNCRGCHGPHVYGDESFEPQGDRSKYSCSVEHETRPTPFKPVEWKTCVLPRWEIGTDPQVVDNFLDYRYDASALDPSNPFLREIDAGNALNIVTAAVIKRRYEKLGIDPARQWAMNGWGRGTLVRTMDGYKARPLHGIWATPPFLHNGSVRTLYEMLLPAAQRQKTFFVGSREFDPREVGYRDEAVPWAFAFDTSLDGNHNTGHQFADGGPGTIGPLLTHAERLAIIEYVKVLGNPAFAYLDDPAPERAMGAPDSVSSASAAQRPLDSVASASHAAGRTSSHAAEHRTVEPFVNAGPWRCSADLQGASSVIFGDGP